MGVDECAAENHLSRIRGLKARVAELEAALAEERLVRKLLAEEWASIDPFIQALCDGLVEADLSAAAEVVEDTWSRYKDTMSGVAESAALDKEEE